MIEALVVWRYHGRRLLGVYAQILEPRTVRPGETVVTLLPIPTVDPAAFHRQP